MSVLDLTLIPTKSRCPHGIRVSKSFSFTKWIRSNLTRKLAYQENITYGCMRIKNVVLERDANSFTYRNTFLCSLVFLGTHGTNGTHRTNGTHKKEKIKAEVGEKMWFLSFMHL